MTRLGWLALVLRWGRCRKRVEPSVFSMPFRALVRLPLDLFQGLCEEHRAGAGACSERCRADPRWRVLMTKTDGPISASGRGVGITLGEALQARRRASSAEAQAEQPRIDALFTHHRFDACAEWLFCCWRQGISLHVGGCEEARNRPDAARNGPAANKPAGPTSQHTRCSAGEEPA